MKGLWDRTTITVKVHEDDCPMLSTAKGATIVLEEEDVEDMEDRGYTVVQCKCVPKEN